MLDTLGKLILLYEQKVLQFSKREEAKETKVYRVYNMLKMINKKRN